MRLPSMIGNRAFAELVAADPPRLPRPAVQRVQISTADAGETLYEDPGAGQTQFQPHSYGSDGIRYEMTRSGDAVEVKVRILFVNQARDQRRNLPNGQPNPNFTQPVGPQTAVPANDPRRGFASGHCESIQRIWNGKYVLVGRRLPTAPSGTPPANPPAHPAPAPRVSPPAGPAPPAPTGPDPNEIRLPVRFAAEPVFDLAQAGTAHKTVRLFGPAVVADRSGAHPVDAGNWYMNTERNYAGMDMEAIYAHEYGHLIGLPDEYSRSNDQIHQQLHRMGGGAASSGAEMDRQTVRRMVATALVGALTGRLQATVQAVSAAFMAQKQNLRRQMIDAIRTTWGDSGLRDSVVAHIQPQVPERLQREVPGIVAFQMGQNLSNVTVATEALSGMTVRNIERRVVGLFRRRFQDVIWSPVSVTGADGTRTDVTMEFSQNVQNAATTGAGAAQGTAIADRVIGPAGPRIPPVGPSTTLIGQLEAIPATWNDPGAGLGDAYTPASVQDSLGAAIASVSATGAFIGINRQGLFRRVLSIVNSTVRETSREAVGRFLDAGVVPRVNAQADGVLNQIDNEVAQVMGMTAGTAAASAPRDPQIQAIATQMHTLLTSQQNPGSRTQAADINPGRGSAGMDVRYTASSMMGPNNTAPEGFRADMLQPVVDQFNSQPALRDPAVEEAFRGARA